MNAARIPLNSVLRHFDAVAVSAAVRAETRSRENHLPPISVYRWWARRTDAVNGALLEAVARDAARSRPLVVADPFVGGGVIALSALRRGHKVYAQDLNPWVTMGMQAMLSLPSSDSLESAFERLKSAAKRLQSKAYATTFSDGGRAEISQSMRVAVSACTKCGHRHRLFPHALVTQLNRRETGKPEALLACRHGHLFEGLCTESSVCPKCSLTVEPGETYLANRTVTCPCCGHQETLEQRASNQPWDWELVLVERVEGRRREIDQPTEREVLQAGSDRWKPGRNLGKIPTSPETQVLLRHGFASWSDLYPTRQRFVVERLLRLAAEVATTADEALALQMAVLGSTEMAGHLSRWDRFYLKSYESMASHRFNLTTFSVEPNVMGAGQTGRGTVARRIGLFKRAATWLEREGARSTVQTLSTSDGRVASDEPGVVTVVSGSSEKLLLNDGCVDLVLTDPPYHDDVQYHELSLPLRAWAKLTRVRPDGEAIAIPHSASLKGHRAYRGVLERIFNEFHRVLRPDGRLLFSYANREPVAWVNLFAALRAAGLRPLGFAIVHSENESDLSKRNGRACSLDLILELVRKDAAVGAQHRATPVFGTDEESYLLAVGDAFLRSGDIVDNWAPSLVQRLRTHAFVRGAEPSPLESDPETSGQSLRAFG